MPFIDTLTETDFGILSDDMKTNKELCERFNVGPATISRTLKALGIKKKLGSKKGVSKPKPDKQKQVTCKTCGKEETVALSRHYTYCSRACMNVCDDYRAKLSNMDKSYMQTEEYRASLRKESSDEYVSYRNRVHKLTAKVYDENVDLINPIGYNRGRCGTEGAYQLDHVVPVSVGFSANIPPEAMAVLENIRMLPWEENLERNKKANYALYEKAVSQATYLIDKRFCSEGSYDRYEEIMKLASKMLLKWEKEPL